MLSQYSQFHYIMSYFILWMYMMHLWAKWDPIEYALYVPYTVQYWPEDGYELAETCRHLIICNLVVF